MTTDDLDVYLAIAKRDEIIVELTTRIASQAAEIERLKQWQREMVEIQASGGRLDGYREMGAQIAAQAAEIERITDVWHALHKENIRLAGINAALEDALKRRGGAPMRLNSEPKP